MRIIYNFLVYIFIIFSPLIIIYRIFKKKENPKRFLEKFSVNKEKRKEGKLIWFHCSSVGENNKFKTGDKVLIIESKPYSKNKKFQVMENSK